MAKKKIAKLTDEQYQKYIMTLKNEPSLYNANGELQVPDELKNEENDKLGE